MKKLVLFIISIMIIMGITVYADSSTQYNFNDYSVLSEVYPGRLFSQHTKASPVFEKLNNVNCLKIGSASDTDNIVLMNSNTFKDGSFSVSFSMTASAAPSVNWGLAPSVIVRYLDANGKWVNDRIIEYAYNVVRVKDNGKETKVATYYKSIFNNITIDVTRKGNTYTVNYKIGTKSYKNEYTTCDNGEVCVGFFSYKGNSLYLKNISFDETFSKGQTAKNIKSAFNAKNPAHPRILMDSDRLVEIRSMIKDDEKVKGWYENVKKKAGYI